MPNRSGAALAKIIQIAKSQIAKSQCPDHSQQLQRGVARSKQSINFIQDDCVSAKITRWGKLLPETFTVHNGSVRGRDGDPGHDAIFSTRFPDLAGGPR